MDLAAAMERIDVLTGIIWLCVGTLVVLALFLMTLPECDPDCSTCKARRYERDAQTARRYFGIKPGEDVTICPLHRIPRIKCPPGSHDE